MRPLFAHLIPVSRTSRVDVPVFAAPDKGAC